MGEAMVAKTERNLTLKEKEVFAEAKIQLEKIIGLTSKIGTLDNLAQWISYDGTIEMLDVFARGEINKENYLIFEEKDKAKVKIALNTPIDLTKIKKNLEKYVLGQTEVSKKIAKKRANLILDLITGKQTERLNAQFLTGLPIYLKTDIAPDDSLLLDLFLEKTDLYLNNPGILAKEIYEGNWKLEKETVLFTREQFDELNEQLKIAIHVFEALKERNEELLETDSKLNLEMISTKINLNNVYKKKIAKLKAIEKDEKLMFQLSEEEYSKEKGIILKTKLELFSKEELDKKKESFLRNENYEQIKQAFEYCNRIFDETVPTTEEMQVIKAKLTKLLKDDNLL